MGLKFYADRGSRRTRQIVADVALALWCVLAIWAGTVVHDRALVAQSGAQKLEHGSSSLALDMTDDPVLMFKSPGKDDLNIVYRRTDGNIGWIDAANMKS